MTPALPRPVVLTPPNSYACTCVDLYWPPRRGEATVSVRLSVLGVALVVLVAGCGGDDGGTAPGASGVELVKDGKIVTCTHLPYEPFQFEQGGKTVGFDVD